MTQEQEIDLKRLFSNPFYCLKEIAREFTYEHATLVSEEEWIKCGVKLIDEIGAEEYLKNLLENLKGNYESLPKEEQK